MVFLVLFRTLCFSGPHPYPSWWGGWKVSYLVDVAELEVYALVLRLCRIVFVEEHILSATDGLAPVIAKKLGKGATRPLEVMEPRVF